MEQVNEFFDVFKDPKEKAIINQMRRLGVSSYKINKDFSVDLTNNTTITARLIEECPVNFNRCNGNFIWHYSDLKTMKNLPKIVNGNFSVANNKISTLEESQTMNVIGTFNVSGNPIKNLKGSPKQCNDLIAMMCDLNSLEGSPVTVNGDFLVTRNKLKSLNGCPTKVGGIFEATNNPLELENIKDEIAFFGAKLKTDWSLLPSPIKVKEQEKEKEKEEVFEKGDTIIYRNKTSQFKDLKATITDVIPASGNVGIRYNIFFKMSDNPELLKDSGVANVSSKNFERVSNEFTDGDLVKMNNPKSKYNGFKGTIDSVSAEGEYKVRFEFKDNPGIENVVSDANKNGTMVYVNKIKPQNLLKIELNEFNISPQEPTTTDTGTEIIEKDPRNTFNEGDTAMFLNKKVKLLKLKSPLFWKVKYVDEEDNKRNGEFQVHCNQLLPYNPDVFRYGDKIIYLDPGGEYDECKGRVTYSYQGKIDIEIFDKFGIRRTLHTVERYKLEMDDSSPPAPTMNPLFQGREWQGSKPPEGKYKKDDKVVYIAKKDDKNKEYHLCKGTVTFINKSMNDWTKVTYDVLLDKQKGVEPGKNTSLFLIDEDQLNPVNQKLAEGDKVVYRDSDHPDLDGKIGNISKIINGQYEITFNVDKVIVTLAPVSRDNLTKYSKMIGADIRTGDKIIFTKANSKYFGYKGEVTFYDKWKKEKPFEIELLTKSHSYIRLDASEQNLELIPPKEKLKEGDTIKFSKEGHDWDGSTGKIDKVLPDDNYSIILKGDGASIWMEASIDNLVLLQDVNGFRIGDKVIYNNPNSKYNGAVAEYDGTRWKDGKDQLIIKIDNKRIYFDKDEATLTLDPTQPRPAPPVTYSYTAPAATTRTFKKKKKEAPVEREPVLVYNRRPIARKVYQKPGSEPATETKKNSDLEEGDKVTILSCVNPNVVGKTGKIISGPAGDKRYQIEIENFQTRYWLLKSQLKKVEE